jgi:diguanylate cyclase (GGDEF)-like protein
MARSENARVRKDELPADIHAELVETLFGTPGSFLSGLAGGLLVPAIAWIRTHDPIFLVCTVVLVILAAFRLLVFVDHGRADGEQRRRQAARWEKLYAIGAVGFMLAVGLTAAILFLRREDALATIYAVVITLGIAGALAGRNAGRPRIVYGQVWAVCGPLAVTLLFNYDTWYWGLSAMFALILTSVKSTTKFLNGILVSALLNGREAGIQRARFGTALDSMSHGLCMGDRDGSITVVNQRLQEFFQLEIGGVEIGVRELAERIAASGGMPPVPKQAFVRSWETHVAKRDSSVFSATIGGRIFDFRCEPEVQGGFVVVIEDVTAARIASREIERMAHFDSLTGLPNRSQFHTQLSRLLSRPLDRSEQMALLSVDLDQFKEVNDARGHATGDELLRMVAKRLRQSVKSADLVARFGGDEFQVLLRTSADPQALDTVARRIIEDLSQSYCINGQLISIGASIGSALAPRDATGADELLRCADMALYRAKADGRGAHRAFAPEMEVALRRKREVEEHLRDAIANDKLQLHYQPVVDSRTGAIVACEALVRLPHPAEGMVPPSEFIPVAEDSGLVVKLGDWVLRRACRDAVTWPKHLRVAVNFSPKQFVLGRNIAADITSALSAAGLEPHRLEVEITESTIMEAKDSLQQLTEISRSGVKISLDDFGTGYSSLSYLRQFPVDKIKIDRSFAFDIKSQASQAVIRSVAVMAGLLEVELVIEGIETKAQLEVLKSWNVHLVQGYFFSSPRPLADLMPILHTENPFGKSRLQSVA